MKLTQKKIKEMFRYKDGNLIRKTSNNRSIKVGSIAGHVKPNGYIVTIINGKLYKNHRLIWLYHYGYFPENDIDHIDRNRYNNKIENLREVSSQCNSRNTGNFKHNKSGVKGVYWSKQRNRWVANIAIYGTSYYLGAFKLFYEAVCHRLAAEQCLNWSNCDSSSPAYQYVKKIQEEYNGKIDK